MAMSAMMTDKSHGKASLDLRHYVQDIPDFPKPGILFRDISPMLRDPLGWAEVMDRLGTLCDSLKPDLIVGIEARGFIVGMGLATHKELGFVSVRKPGKLPGNVYGVDYALEYGTDRLEIHADAMRDQPRILVVDDLLATGGTAAATTDLVKKAGGRLVGCAFIVELTALEGRRRLPDDIPVEALIHYS